MRIALDTNFLVYIEGLNDTERRSRARFVIDRLTDTELVIPLQVMGELYNVLKKKAALPPDEIVESIDDWGAMSIVVPTRWQDFRTALHLATVHNLQIWDASIVAVAAGSQCDLLLSEDMQDGFSFGGLTIVNPFVDPFPDLLKRALNLPH